MSSKERRLAELELMKLRLERETFHRLFPDKDTLHGNGVMFHAREKYPRHMEFFGAGKDYRERAAMCANRVGKTFSMGGYELTCHLTGQYPGWWMGRVFKKPIEAWAAGKTNETTRDILQTTLLGKVKFKGGTKGFAGKGVVPVSCIGKPSWRQGVSDLIDTIQIGHVSGGSSTLGLKSYQQGRGSFEGTAQDVILLDEEPPFDIYGECLTRTATTNGLIMLTFTPLEGISETVQQFMGDA